MVRVFYGAPRVGFVQPRVLRRRRAPFSVRNERGDSDGDRDSDVHALTGTQSLSTSVSGFARPARVVSLSQRSPSLSVVS